MSDFDDDEVSANDDPTPPKPSEAVEDDGAVTTTLTDVLKEMGDVYSTNPTKAVRGQAFIKLLHQYVGDELEARLSPAARERGIKVVYEPTILGSTKPKNVDVALMDPENGPILLIGCRSQMSSVGKNVLTYYEGIVGECISLQDRFPMSTHGYVYLHPLKSIKEGSEDESIDHARYARLYASATGRSGPMYKTQRGLYDHFAYLVVDFNQNPPVLRDDIVEAAAEADLKISGFVERMIATFKQRNLFWEIF